MRIAGIDTYLPVRIADNDYFSRITGKPSEWFLKRTGIRERRRAADGENANALAVQAAKALTATLGHKLSEVDYILGCSYTPWDTIATMAHVVQRELGLGAARALYISSACSSVINAAEIAAALFESRRSRTILLVAAEHNSLYARDDDPQSGHLWGDGAAAMLLTGGETGDFQVVDVTTAGYGHLGRGPEAIYLTPRGEGLVMPFGKDVFAHACREMESSARSILERNGLSPADLRLFVPHQANKRIFDHVGRELGIPTERLASTIETLGNTGCVSVLITLHAYLPQLDVGDWVLLTVFGGGYSAGSALLRRC